MAELMEGMADEVKEALDNRAEILLVSMGKAEKKLNSGGLRRTFQNLMNGSLSGYKKDGSLAHKPFKLDHDFGDRSSMQIRQVVLDAYARFMGAGGDYENIDVLLPKDDNFRKLEDMRSETLAKLSKVLVEAGLVTPTVLAKGEKAERGEVYRITAGGGSHTAMHGVYKTKELVAMCMGQVGCGCSAAGFQPYFEYDRAEIGGDNKGLGVFMNSSEIGGGNFGRGAVLSNVDVRVQNIGYLANGEMVTKRFGSVEKGRFPL
ncbi:hypothetical protein JKY72_06545 [Candidatus Gracilibacteria bacterium]|nr:hypothetical protein [Candidatus Gracilibacteria bacterium]